MQSNTNDHLVFIKNEQGEPVLVYRSYILIETLFFHERQREVLYQRYKFSQDLQDIINKALLGDCSEMNVITANHLIENDTSENLELIKAVQCFLTCYLAEEQKINSYFHKLITESRSPSLAYTYSLHLGADAEMRQIIVDANNPQWAYEYINTIKNDAEMRQIIVDAGDPKYAFWYCKNIQKDAEMRQVILDSGDKLYALMYCTDVANDADMLNITQQKQSA